MGSQRLDQLAEAADLDGSELLYVFKDGTDRHIKSDTYRVRRVEDVVANHGAVGDNTTDDSAAIQAAIDTGNPVLIPAGFTFRIDTGLVVSTDGQEIVGNGDGSHIVNQSTDPAIKLSGTSSDRLRRCRVALLQVEGNNTDSGDGVALEHTTGSTIERVYAHKNAIGINFVTGSFTNSIIDCEPQNNRLQGVRLGPASNATYAQGGRWAQNGSEGLLFDNDGTASTSSQITLVAVDIEGNERQAVWCPSTPNGANMRVYALALFGCHLEDNCRSITEAQLVFNSGAQGRTVVGCYFNGNSNATHPMRVGNDNTGLFAGNRVQGHSTQDYPDIQNTNQGWLVAQYRNLAFNRSGDVYPGDTGAVDLTQQTAPASLTDNSGGTTDDTVEAVSGSGADAAINNNFAELTEELNQIRTALVNMGFWA